MSLETLLGDLSRQHFSEEYLHRLPLALPETAASLSALGTWDVLGRLLKEAADVLVVGEGRRYEGIDPADLDEARALIDRGLTILVRHAERHDQPLGELAADFQNDFNAHVDVHMYVTPPDTHGFSWHYDAEDVFIIQTSGTKTYSLRKNTVNPWPLVETIPVNMRYERELMPLMQVELRAGDWLYIPCGYWHKADTPAGDDVAISLAVGVMSPAAVDVLEMLRPRLLSSLLWRQRLPITGQAGHLSDDELDAHLKSVCDQLAADLSGTLSSEHLPAQLRDWLRRRVFPSA